METKQLRFTGYSDDTFSCVGPGIDVDCDTCASGRPVAMSVKAGGAECFVVGQYAPAPCGGWLIGLAPGGNEEMPPWSARYEDQTGHYSPLLIIEAPADAVVTIVGDTPHA